MSDPRGLSLRFGLPCAGVLSAVALAAGPAPLGGDVDTSFDPLLGMRGTIVRSIALQADGAMLLGGDFDYSTGTGLMRIHPDGSKDTSFAAGARPVHGIAVQPDQKIVCVGAFTIFGQEPRNRVARFGPTGAVDPEFLHGMSGADGAVYAVALQSDGKILIGGAFTSINGVPRNRIARLLSDGAVDPSFLSGSSGVDGPVLALAVQPDGKILLGGGFSSVNGVARRAVARLDPDGALDAAFRAGLDGPDGDVRALVVQSDGRVLLGGDFGAVDLVERPFLARLQSGGELDPSFAAGASGPDGMVRSLALQSDGRVVIGGEFTAVHGAPRNRIARLSAEGALDASFQDGMSGASGSVYALLTGMDGRLLVGGEFGRVNGEPLPFVAQLAADGAPDPGFSQSAIAFPSYPRSMALQPDGKVVLGGSSFTTENRLWRLNADGSRDPTLHVTVTGVSIEQNVFAVAVQSDGKILLSGAFFGVNGVPRKDVARLHPDGSVDLSFQDPNVTRSVNWPTVYAVAPHLGGKVLIGGLFQRIGGVFRTSYARLNEDGTLDTSFPQVTGGLVTVIAVQSDGRILLNAVNSGLVRLNPDGSLDPTFSNSASLFQIASILVQPDGKLIVGGSFSTPRQRIARLNADGSLDAGFDAGTFAGSESITSLALQVDGKILVGGEFANIQGMPRQRIARLNSDGSLDPSFQDGMGGASDYVSVVGVQPDGRVLLAGAFREVNGLSVPVVARLHGEAVLAPAITSQPESHVAYDGCCTALHVSATGGALDYHWRRDGVLLEDGGDISGARTSALHIGPLSAAHTGSYDVVVSNVVGSAVSDAGIVTVADPPACRATTCEAAAGCVLSDAADGTACDDGNACSTADTCGAGVCAGTIVDDDGDGVAQPCDNCPAAANPTQSDFDQDREGDRCDLNDGFIFQWRDDRTSLTWQSEAGPETWNVYLGDLDVLRATGAYTQAPGSNPLALRHCALDETSAADLSAPATGQVSFSLVTGLIAGIEGPLGTSSSGPRDNANPCP